VVRDRRNRAKPLLFGLARECYRWRKLNSSFNCPMMTIPYAELPSKAW
jgi:hypothetical protein